jgi:cytoskeletal protein CcmA (bactofilin family)
MEANNQPAPETLQTQPDPSSNEGAAANSPTPDKDKDKDAKGASPDKAAEKLRPRRAYRPSHKGTFIGLAVVIIILGGNAGVIGFLIKKQAATNNQGEKGQVTISQSALEKLGVNRTAVGDAGIELTINPDAKFKGDVKIAGDASISGELKLNGKFSAPDASFTTLQGGKTALQQLDVNGDATVSSLNLRKDLVVAGSTRLQGTTTFSQLVTINNNLNVSGNLAVGGSLSVNNFHTSSLSVDTAITIGGHIITRGLAPSVGPGGSALGSNGTVSISGNDASGTVAVNTGVGATSGLLANIAFRSAYSFTPHVVISSIGAANASAYISRTASGFSIYTSNPLPPGGYAFDYIVMQ